MKRFLFSLLFVFVWFVCQSQTVMVSLGYADEPQVEVFVSDNENAIWLTFETEEGIATTNCFPINSINWEDTHFEIKQNDDSFCFEFECVNNNSGFIHSYEWSVNGDICYTYNW